MIESQYGRIVNIASSAGKWSSRNQSAYNVSKHAVVGLTRCVALETASKGVTVNAICPGFVQTDMVEALKTEVAKSAGLSAEQMMQMALSRVPMGRFMEVDDITGLALYLGSQESAGMTGQSISIDGGMVVV
jgi:NAD(P)-dependent dehydrogenase (short-subunit alcohol dehydrogenase family)